mgnify:CR=1 FL=1
MAATRGFIHSYLLSRRLDPRSGAVLVWGRVAAGETNNVIPSTGVAEGTIRLLDASLWEGIGPLLTEVVEAVPADAVRVVARTRSARRWSTSAWAGMSATSTGVGAAESATVVHHCRFRCPAAASAPGRRRPDMPARRTAGRA